MFKKILSKIIFTALLSQYSYANDANEKIANDMEDAIKYVSEQYNQGNKEIFIDFEKTMKKCLISEDDNDKEFYMCNYSLVEVYHKTEQYEKAIPYQKQVIKILEKHNFSKLDISKEQVKLSALFAFSRNISESKHYAGIACDNGNQDGCELYRTLNALNK